MFSKKGFTLLEVLFVVLVLAALAGLAIPRITATIQESRENTCRANMSIINSQIELFRLNTGAYPVDQTAFNDFLNNTTYFSDHPDCPFGNDYLYDATNDRVNTTGHGTDH